MSDKLKALDYEMQKELEKTKHLIRKQTMQENELTIIVIIVLGLALAFIFFS